MVSTIEKVVTSIPGNSPVSIMPNETETGSNILKEAGGLISSTNLVEMAQRAIASSKKAGNEGGADHENIDNFLFPENS